MRTIVKLLSITLGILVLGVTFGGEVQYRGMDSPIVNIIVGGALILAPIDALIYLGVYLLLIGTLIAGSAIGGIIGAKMLGSTGAILGGIAGIFVGGWIATKLEIRGIIEKLRGESDGE